MDKRGQVTTQLISGIAGLIILVIISLVVVITLTGSGLLDASRQTTTVTNETNAWLNTTGYTLDRATSSEKIATGTYTITAIWGNSPNGNLSCCAYNYSIATANSTVNSTGFVTNATAVANATIYDNVSLTYTFQNQTKAEFTSNKLSANLSGGVDEVAKKVPTLLKIAIIVVLITVLAILVVRARRSGLLGESNL